jgi:GrpB-like predicted nucleotidyltransferase (UPF0157 family)
MPRPNEQKIAVVDYDPVWPGTFAALRAPISEALTGIALAVEHVGSTSVPGLVSKPIIDMDVVVGSRTDLPAAIEKLASLGYVHRGNLGIEDREAFDSPVHLPAHHLYVCVQGSAALANHLAIRDYLRRNQAAAAIYGQLKRQLAERFPLDIDSYIAGKTDFLVEVLQGAGFPEPDLRAIRAANRKK